MRSTLLILDAIIKLSIGFMLMIFPRELFWLVGLPVETPPFYAILLGGILVGIGIALLHEHLREPGGIIGLGLGGAIIINLYGALVLAALMLTGRPAIPRHGHIVLWGLVVLLTAMSGGELLAHRESKNAAAETDDEHEV